MEGIEKLNDLGLYLTERYQEQQLNNKETYLDYLFASVSAEKAINYIGMMIINRYCKIVNIVSTRNLLYKDITGYTDKISNAKFSFVWVCDLGFFLRT